MTNSKKRTMAEIRSEARLRLKNLNASFLKLQQLINGRPPRKAISGSYSDALDFKDWAEMAQKETGSPKGGRSVILKRTARIDSLLNDYEKFV